MNKTKYFLLAATLATSLIAPGAAGFASPASQDDDAPFLFFHGPGGIPRTAEEFPGEPPVFAQRYVDDRAALEPQVAFTSDGTAFYMAFNKDGDEYGELVRGTGLEFLTEHNRVYRSRDDGHTWENVSLRVLDIDPHVRDIDPWLHRDPVTDRLFAVRYANGCVLLEWTDDEGETWAARPGICMAPPNILTDHPVLWSGPPTHRQTIGYPSVLYLCVNTIAGLNEGTARSQNFTACQESLDGGITWGPDPTLVPVHRGEHPFAPCPESPHGATGYGLADPESGASYIPAGVCGSAQLGRSLDNGLTWETVIVDDTVGVGPGFDNHITRIARDDAGNLYYAWLDAKSMPRLSISRDAGTTWSSPMDVGFPGLTWAKLPMLAADAEGRIAIAYVGSTVPGGLQATDEDLEDATWHAYVGVSLNALDDDPVFATTTVGPGSDPIHRGPCVGRCELNAPENDPLRGVRAPPVNGLYDQFQMDINPATGNIWLSLADQCVEACLNEGAPADRNRGAVGIQVAGSHLGEAIEKKDTDLKLTVEGRGESMTLTARLTELDSSDPIAGRTIDFFSDSAFMGSDVTDSDGIAVLAVPPEHRGANRTYEAVFEGDDSYSPSSDSRPGKGGGGDGNGRGSHWGRTFEGPIPVM